MHIVHRTRRLEPCLHDGTPLQAGVAPCYIRPHATTLGRDPAASSRNPLTLIEVE